MKSRRLNNELRLNILKGLIAANLASDIEKAENAVTDLAVTLVKKYRDKKVVSATKILFEYERGNKWTVTDSFYETQAHFRPDRGSKADTLQGTDFLRLSLHRSTHVRLMIKEHSDPYRSSFGTFQLRNKKIPSGLIPIQGERFIIISPEEYEKLTEAEDEYKEVIRRTEEAITAARVVIDSVTTVKRLLEVWPEIEPYIPSIIQGKNLPDINHIIN